MSALASLLAPRRIAILGSLSRASGLGSRTLAHLEGAGYDGEIVQAKTAGDVTEPVDLAIVAVPAAAAGDVVAELGERAANVVVYSSGFGEAASEGAPALGPRVGAGTRLVGPNTVGYYYAPSRTVATFAQAFDPLTDCRHGDGVFLVSQSGAFGARLVTSARRHGLDYDGFLATGNEDGVRACAFGLELLADERFRPRVLALYLESIRDGREFERMLAAARDAGVRVALLCGGRSASGAAAARSHTAAVSPDSAIVEELCAEHGAAYVNSDRALVEATLALTRSIPPPPHPAPTPPPITGKDFGGETAGRDSKILPHNWGAPGAVGGRRGVRAAIVTGSGGAGVVGADLLAERGMRLAELSGRTRDALAAMLPSYAAVANPVDVTAQVIADTERLARVCATLADSGDTDAILVVGRAEQAAALREVAARVPVALAVLDGDATSGADAVRDGLPVLPSLEAACNALWAATVAAFGGCPRLLDEVRAENSPVPVPQKGHFGSPSDNTGGLSCDTVASLRAVEGAGIAVPAWREVRSAGEAEAALAELGPIVVLKANLPAEAHKAAAGGVRLDVTRDTVAEAAEELLRLAPSVVCARQVRAGPELMVGVRRHPEHGLVVVAGLGGGNVELIARTVTVRAAVPAERLRERLAEEIFAAGGERYAHLPRLLTDAAGRLARLADRYDLALAECNPLVPYGDQLLALDARVVAT